MLVLQAPARRVRWAYKPIFSYAENGFSAPLRRGSEAPFRNCSFSLSETPIPEQNAHGAIGPHPDGLYHRRQAGEGKKQGLGTPEAIKCCTVFEFYMRSAKNTAFYNAKWLACHVFCNCLFSSRCQTSKTSVSPRRNDDFDDNCCLRLKMHDVLC